MEETIRGIIPNTHTGLFGQKAFSLILTDKRLIIAALTSDMIKQAAKEKAEESKEQGDGILKRMVKTAFAGVDLYKKYYEMPIESILSENPGNYYLEPSMVNKISVKQGHYDDSSGRSTPNEIKIKSTQGKHVFTFASPSAKEAKALLSQTFGAVVK
jgi:hypothetical protein